MDALVGSTGAFSLSSAPSTGSFHFFNLSRGEGFSLSLSLSLSLSFFLSFFLSISVYFCLFFCLFFSFSLSFSLSPSYLLVFRIAALGKARSNSSEKPAQFRRSMI